MKNKVYTREVVYENIWRLNSILNVLSDEEHGGFLDYRICEGSIEDEMTSLFKIYSS